jgi:hypothetical protein
MVGRQDDETTAAGMSSASFFVSSSLLMDGPNDAFLRARSALSEKSPAGVQHSDHLGSENDINSRFSRIIKRTIMMMMMTEIWEVSTAGVNHCCTHKPREWGREIDLEPAKCHGNAGSERRRETRLRASGTWNTSKKAAYINQPAPAARNALTTIISKDTTRQHTMLRSLSSSTRLVQCSRRFFGTTMASSNHRLAACFETVHQVGRPGTTTATTTTRGGASAAAIASSSSSSAMIWERLVQEVSMLSIVPAPTSSCLFVSLSFLLPSFPFRLPLPSYHNICIGRSCARHSRLLFNVCQRPA